MIVEMEEIVKELISLRKTPRLSGKAMKRARELLIRLRKMGYTPDQIEELTKGVWKAATVKYHTKGVTTSDSDTPRQSLDIIAEMGSQGVNLEMVKQANHLNSIAVKHAVTFDEMSRFIAEARESGMDVGMLVSVLRELKKEKVPIAHLAETLSNYKLLGEMGIGNSQLRELAKVISKQGDRQFDNTMEIIKAAGSLKAIQLEVKTVTEIKNQTEAKEKSLRSNCEDLEKRERKIQQDLRVHKQLQDDGFDKDVLEKLKLSAKRFGGPVEVLDAINRYETLDMLRVETDKARNSLEGIQAKISKHESEYIHLRQVTEMCDELLQSNYSTLVVKQILDCGRKYGGPIEVLKAIDEYGKLLTIRKETQQESRKRDTVKGEVQELESRLATLKGHVAAFEQSINKIGDLMLARFAAIIDLGEKRAQEMYQGEGIRLRKSVDEYAATAKKAGALEDELNLVRLIILLSRVPMPEPPPKLSYAIRFLDLAIQVIRTNGMNAKMKDSKVTIIDYIEYAKRELETLGRP